MEILIRNFTSFFNPLENKTKQKVSCIDYMFWLCPARQPIRAQRELAGRSSSHSVSSANQKQRDAFRTFCLFQRPSLLRCPAVIGQIHLRLPVSCHSERRLCAEAPPPPLLRHECELSEIYDLSGGFSLHLFTSNTSVTLSKRRES